MPESYYQKFIQGNFFQGNIQVHVNKQLIVHHISHAPHNEQGSLDAVEIFSNSFRMENI